MVRAMIFIYSHYCPSSISSITRIAATQVYIMTQGRKIGNHLLLLPNEIIVKLFCHLSSLSEVLALAAVIRALRLIWTGNITHIYYQVAPQSISCERHARKFREDQRGSFFESCPMSAQDVICIARNSRIVEKSVLQFEREIVCKVKGNEMV